MEVLNLPAVVFSLLLQLSSVATLAQNNFSGDSALAVLRVLSVDIGARPMGSPAEQRAMQFAVEKFREFGCQQAYIMPMTVADGVNTNSGIAIGVLKGKTDRIIIIGGHIDSSGPDVPGANDDGSGVACVLELARVLSKQQHESTIMFCCWGGEEQDLQGSKYFVDHFTKLDSVDLMLQIDMADGSSVLEIDPDYGEKSAPRWLTKAAYEIFFDELHASGLVYPIASATLNAATGGATGSDHDSFLEKGIPAIDFTSDVDYPIHTPQDHLENFQPSGLKRTGDLVLRLVERFDAGVPTRTTERYMLFQLGTIPVFLSYWILWTFICLALVLAVVAIVALRKRRVLAEGTERVRWSAIKLVFFTLIIQTFIWISEAIFGLLKGYRFPWVNNFSSFVLLGILFGLIGLWLALKLVLRLRLSTDAFVLGWRSLAALIALTSLTALRNPELAVFPGLATLFMSFAFLSRSSGFRVTCWMLSCLVTLRLVFFEELGLIQRLVSENRIHVISGLIAYEAAYVVFFTVISLPFVLGFAGIYRAAGVDLFWLKKFRSTSGLFVVTGLVICLSIYLMLQPVYDARWYNTIIVEQRYTFGSDSSSIALKASENMEGTRVRAGSWEMPGRTNFHEFTRRQSSFKSWTALDRIAVPIRSTGDTIIVLRNVQLHSELRPYTMTISYRSSLPFTVESKWAHGGSLRLGRETDSLKIFSWYCFPDTDLVVPISFGLRKGQVVAEEIEATYDTLAYGLRLQREFTNIRYRTVLIASDSFSTANPRPAPRQ